MTGAWFPKAGDVVTFEDLPPNALNRGRRYLITGIDGNQVSYRPAGQPGWLPCMDYAGRLGNLWLKGMTGSGESA